ncbi:hypothetical protein [Ornithinibacillus bavariensis]|uniref:hypothetical protein n=1 Tax=Ornithinibacillus bavariensis TaxID=545502 RepID=UPI003D224FB6
MKIRFFEENEFLIKKAIGPGIYNIKIGLSGENNSDYESLYIGKSYSMITRCSTHLYELHKDPSYFGLSVCDMTNNNLELNIEIFESLDIDEELSSGEKDILLRERELEAIKKLKPLSQLETSDRLKKNRVDIVQSFLKALLKQNEK